MKLQILTLEATKKAEIPKNVIPFRWKVHHVKEIFLSLLPKIEVGNSSKIEISFGPQGEETSFDGELGVTNIFIENFDFQKFYAVPIKEQELITLEIIKKSLLSLCERNGGESSVINAIESTAREVIAAEFNLRIEIKRLAKKSADRKQEINVYRILNAEVVEAWLCTVTDKSNEALIEKWMTQVPNYLNRMDYFKKAELKGGTYLVYNAFGKPVFEVRLSKIPE